MERETRKQVEQYRSTAGPIENNVIDELIAGDVDRQEFLRRATMFGIGAGTIGAAAPLHGRGRRRIRCPGGRACSGAGRSASVRPAVGSSFEPRLLREAGSLSAAAIPGEYLTFSNQALQVKPWLATSWKPNAALTRWTFQLRRGVKFHNGRTMNADDVVATFKQYLSVTPSEILSAIPASLLGPEGVVKRGPYTVEFRLKQPSNAFPQLVSQTTYQAIIQPASVARNAGTWVSSGMIGTGPFRLKGGTPNRRLEFVRFPGYWGGNPPLDGVVFTWYEGTAPQVLALRGGQLDLCVQLNPQEVAAFRTQQPLQGLQRADRRRTGCSVCASTAIRSGTRECGAPLRWRSTVRTSSSRILLGTGTLGNDSPFWSRFPSTDPSIKQRKQNLELARSLLRAAGQENLKFTLTTWNGQDHPDHAQAIQAVARQAGHRHRARSAVVRRVLRRRRRLLRDHAVAQQARDAHRVRRSRSAEPVPHRRVHDRTGSGTHRTTRTPRSTRQRSSTSPLPTIAAQRRATKKMAGFLLRDTPVITDYFITFVTAGAAKVQNYQAEAISHVRLAKTFLRQS